MKKSIKEIFEELNKPENKVVMINRLYKEMKREEEENEQQGFGK